MKLYFDKLTKTLLKKRFPKNSDKIIITKIGKDFPVKYLQKKKSIFSLENQRSSDYYFKSGKCEFLFFV